MTPDLIKNGGSAVEGMIFSHSLNSESQNDSYLKFKNNYIKSFGSEPSFAAVYNNKT